MKILAIRGRNLASLEGDFEIDFTVEPLLSAGIFAISGPTGAGKSTLLDAMCLALFARTPRTDQAKENNKNGTFRIYDQRLLLPERTGRQLQSQYQIHVSHGSPYSIIPNLWIFHQRSTSG